MTCQAMQSMSTGRKSKAVKPRAVEQSPTHALKRIEQLLAWDPDYTKATAAEDAAMSAALEEMRAGEYVTHDAINWE